jgi:hypothetical protein
MFVVFFCIRRRRGAEPSYRRFEHFWKFELECGVDVAAERQRENKRPSRHANGRTKFKGGRMGACLRPSVLLRREEQAHSHPPMRCWFLVFVVCTDLGGGKSGSRYSTEERQSPCDENVACSETRRGISLTSRSLRWKRRSTAVVRDGVQSTKLWTSSHVCHSAVAVARPNIVLH